jgi:hypothetical protein
MGVATRKRTADDKVSAIEQDECWKKEGSQMLMGKLRSTMEKTAWKLPPTRENWFELLRNLLKIIAILLWTIVYHFFFH